MAERRLPQPVLQRAALVARLGEAISNLRGGMPWEDGVALTPLPEPGKSTFLAGYIEDATNRDRAARVVNPGGGEVDATWFVPALLYPVSPDMRIFHEEQFGPVVPLVPFDAVKLAGRQARALLREPDLPRLLRRWVLMGGCFRVAG